MKGWALAVLVLASLLAMAWLGAAAPLLALPGFVLALWRQAPGSARARLLTLAKPVASLLALAGLLLLWPAWRLAGSGSLWAALALSAAFAFLLLAVWRTWPLWRQAVCGQLQDLRGWRHTVEQDLLAWRGLGLAVPVAVAAAVPVLLMVPGLLQGGARVAAALLAALLALAPAALRWHRPGVGHEPKAHRPLKNAEPMTLESLRQKPAAAVLKPVEEAASPAAVSAHSVPDPAELYQAARAGRVEQALALLEAGADPLAPLPADARDRRSLLQLAAVLPDLRLLRALIAKGVPMQAEAGQLTPLLAATRDSWHGRPEAVMTLLANGADPRERDTGGATPLHHAARSTDPGVAALLLDAGAEVDALDEGGHSPLAQAARAGNWRMLKFLSERGAQVQPAGGEPVLLSAAAADEDDPAGVEFLLRRRADVDARGQGGRTALQLAAQAGHVAIVDALLAAGADPLLRDDAGLDAWLLAAEGGHQAVLEVLLSVGADLQACDGEGRDALMRATLAGRATPALAMWLRERGIDTYRLDATGQGALDLAVAEGRWALVAAIDPGYPLPATFNEAEGDVARPPLQLMEDALERGEPAAIRAVAPLLSAPELDRALLLAAQRHPAQLPLLRALGGHLEARNEAGDSALFLLFDAAANPAARQALLDCLNAGAAVAGRGGLARYLAAALAARLPAASGEALALTLLERGADAFAAVDGQAPLALAVRLGWPQLCAALLACGVNPDQTDARGMTALHLAAALGRTEAVQQLLRAGAQPALRAGDGQSAQGIALSAGHGALAFWLDWRLWPHPGRRLRGSDLPAAATSGDAAAVERLLALGLEVDSVDAQGCTALLRAAGGGHLAAVNALLAAGANPGIAATTGATPLSAAASRRHLAVVERLLQAGADVEQPLPGGASVLMLASALGQADVVERLLQAGASTEKGDAEGLLPIHCAALYGFAATDAARVLALFRALRQAGARLSASTTLGVTPVLFLLGARAEPGAGCDENVLLAVLEYLLEAGVDLNTRDPRGFGPLHLAALHGLPKVIRRLLRAGAEPGQRDQLGRVPRDIALMRGLLDVAAEFDHPVVGGGAGNVSVASLLRERR